MLPVVSCRVGSYRGGVGAEWLNIWHGMAWHGMTDCWPWGLVVLLLGVCLCVCAPVMMGMVSASRVDLKVAVVLHILRTSRLHVEREQ